MAMVHSLAPFGFRLSQMYVGAKPSRGQYRFARIPIRNPNRLSTALLLILETGYGSLTRNEASLFFRLASYRDGRGAIMLTTNKSVRD